MPRRSRKRVRLVGNHMENWSGKTVIRGVNIQDLTRAYASQKAIPVTFIHSDGYSQPCCSLKVDGLQRRTKIDREHIVRGKAQIDVNRKGQDASAHLVWCEIVFLYRERNREGTVSN